MQGTARTVHGVPATNFAREERSDDALDPKISKGLSFWLVVLIVQECGQLFSGIRNLYYSINLVALSLSTVNSVFFPSGYRNFVLDWYLLTTFYAALSNP